jgi:multidrug efflux system membrane fusion protein
MNLSMEGTELSDAVPERPQDSRHAPKKPHLPTNFWLITSLVVMVCSIVWFFYAINKSGLAPVKPTPIVSSPAVTQDVPVYLSALGSVIPTYSVTVRTQVTGILQKVWFKEGQEVSEGELLAEIDPRPYEALLNQYEGNLKRDKALLANAHIDLKRYQLLWKQDSVSQQTLATQQSLVEQYEGVVKSDQGLIESTQLNLNYCHIKSPISGRIGLRLVDVGNFIQLSDTTGIAVVNSINPITVVFSLPEDYVPVLINKVYANSLLKVFVYDRQQNELLATGHLLTIDNQIDTSTGTFKLKAEFDNKDYKLFPNQFVNTRILVETIKNAVLVPTSALQHTLTHDFVYVLDKQQARIQKITAGPVVGEQTVIKKGLKSGQLVVVEGADKLVDGARVINEPDSAKPAAPVKTASLFTLFKFS